MTSLGNVDQLNRIHAAWVAATPEGPTDPLGIGFYGLVHAAIPRGAQSWGRTFDFPWRRVLLIRPYGVIPELYDRLAVNYFVGREALLRALCIGH